MSNSGSQTSKSEHVINTTSQKSNDTNTSDTTKVFKLPPIIHTGNSSTTTTNMNDDKLNGRRSLRKKIVPPKRYAKSPINTIDVKIGSSTNASSVQPTNSVPPPTTTTNTTAAQSNKTTDNTSINITMKKRASPRKIKIPSRFIQDGSPTVNNNLDATLNSTTSTAVAAMDPQKPKDVTTDVKDKGTSDIVGGGGASAAVPTKRSSSRKITIPARFTNEEAKLISATCHSISNKKEPNMQGQGSTDMQGKGEVDMQGQGIADNNTVKGLGLVGNEAVAAASRSSSRRSLPPVVHNNNNPINSSTGTTSISSGGAAQQQQDEKPKRGQAGRDALKAKRTAAVLATTEDGTTPSTTAKKKQHGNNKKEVTAKKRSSRRKVPPPTSTNSKSLSKTTNSKTTTVSANGVKRTPAQLKYDTNRPIHQKWFNYHTLLQSYQLKYSSIVINSSGSNGGTKVGIDINSLGKGMGKGVGKGGNSKSGRHRQAKKEEEVEELNKWINKQYLAYRKWKAGVENTGFSEEKLSKLREVGLDFDAHDCGDKRGSGGGKKSVKGSKKEAKKSQGRAKDEKGRFIKATADQGKGKKADEAKSKGTRSDKGIPTGRFHGNQHTKKKEEEAAAKKLATAESKKKKVDGRKNNGRKSIKVATEDDPSASEGMKKKAVPSKPSKKAAGNKKPNEDPEGPGDEPSTTTIQHNDLCEVCAQPGELLSCTTCNLVFHTQCTRPKLDDTNPPGNNWKCSYCLSSGGSRQYNNPNGLGLLDLRKKADREKQSAAKEGVLEMEDMKRVIKEEQEQMLVDEVAKEMAAVDDRKMPATAAGSNFQEDHNDVFNIFQDDDQGIHTMSQDALMNEDILTQESLPSAAAAGGGNELEVAPKVGDVVHVMFDKNQKYTAKIIAVEESDDPADGYEDQQAYDIQIQYDDDGAIEDAKYPDAEITLISSNGGSSRRKGGVRTAKTAGARGIVAASAKSALPLPSKEITSKPPSKKVSSKASKVVSSTLASFKELTPEPPTKKNEKQTPKKRKVYTKREEDPMDETFILSLHSPEDETEVNPLHNAIRRDVWEVRRTMSGKIFFQCGCCKHLPRNKREQLAIVAPQNVETIYRAFIRFMGKHIKKCKHLPKHVAKLLGEDQKRKDGGIWRGTKAYWAESASRRGLVDSEDGKSILFCPLAAAGTKKPFKAPPKKKRKKNKAPTEEKKVELTTKESVSKSGRKRKSTQRLMEQDHSDEDDYETLPSPAKRPAYHRSASSDAAMSRQGMMDYEPSPAKLPAYQRSLSLNSAMIGRGIKGDVPLCSSRHCKKHAVFDGVCAAHGAMQRLYTSNKKLSLSTPLPGLAPKRKRSARKRSPTGVGDMDTLSSPSAMMPPTPYTVKPSKPTVSFADKACNPDSQVNEAVMPVASYAQPAAEPLYTDPVDQLLGNGNLEDFVDMKAGSLPGSPLKSPTKRDQELVDIRSLPSPTKREAFGRSPGAGEDDEMFAQMWLS